MSNDNTRSTHDLHNTLTSATMHLCRSPRTTRLAATSTSTFSQMPTPDGQQRRVIAPTQATTLKHHTLSQPASSAGDAYPEHRRRGRGWV